MFDPVNGTEVTGLDTEVGIPYSSSLCWRERVEGVEVPQNKRSTTSVGRHVGNFAQPERQARVERSEVPKVALRSF